MQKSVHTTGGRKRYGPKDRKVEIDPETQPEVVCMMKTIVPKFKGVHINKVLDIQGKSFKDLPMMNDHRDNNTE